MMNKTHVTLQSLIDNALAYYDNLKNTGAWKTETSCNSQIIVLTTQLLDLRTERSYLVFNKAPLKQDENVPTAGKPRYVFLLWHLEKLTTKSSTL
jgi:hypothetical protein